MLVREENSDDVIGITTFEKSQLFVGICNANFQPPQGNAFTLDVQVMDLAGNVSSISRGRTVPACSATPAGGLLLLALTVLRRRKH